MHDWLCNHLLSMARTGINGSMLLFCLSLGCTPKSIAVEQPVLTPTPSADNPAISLHLHAQEPYTGFAATNHQNGNKYIHAHFKKGLLHGLYQMWDPEGVLIYKGVYKRGLEHGVHMYWEESASQYERHTEYTLHFKKGVLQKKTIKKQPTDLSTAPPL